MDVMFIFFVCIFCVSYFILLFLRCFLLIYIIMIELDVGVLMLAVFPLRLLLNTKRINIRCKVGCINTRAQEF